MIRSSESVAALLDLVQFRLRVSIEVVDASLRPVRSALQGDLKGLLEEDGVRTWCLAVLRTGESRVERTGAGRVLAVYPLRHEREPIGVVLVAASRETAGHDESGEDTEALQTVALLARGIVENEVQTIRHLTRATERIRRMQGTLRFIADLRQLPTTGDMMQAVVQAATIWFDLDCRIYRRAAGGDYVLMGALPGLDPSKVPSQLHGGRLRQLSTARHIVTLADAEFLTRAPGRGGIVMGGGQEDEVVLVLMGSIDREAELTFSAIAQALGGALQLSARAQLARWQRRLAEQASAPKALPERVLLGLVRELCAGISASGARVSLRWADRQRVVAAVNLTPPGEDRESVLSGGRSYRRIEPAGEGREICVEVTGVADRDVDAHTEIDAWVSAVQPWILASPVLRDPEPTAVDATIFERLVHQEVERARRFNLGLALVLIDPGERVPLGSLGDVVRTILRASDLYGPVRGGHMAAVLVHSGPEAAQTVAHRIGQRLGALAEDTTAVRLGQAVFSSECRSGEALIAEALARLGQRKTGDVRPIASLPLQ